MKNNSEPNPHQTPNKQLLHIVNTLLLVLAAAAFLAACGSDASIVQQSGGESIPAEDAEATTESTLNPVSGHWKLVHATLEGDMSIEIPAEAIPTMTIEGSTLRTFLGCNNGAGTVDYDIARDSFVVTELGSEEAACIEEDITRIEEAMLRVLGTATTFTAGNGQLTISDGAQYPSYLEFEIVPAASDDNETN